MVKKLKIPLRIVKWTAFVLIILSAIASMVSKTFQILHLRSIGFNMVSYSPVSIGLGLFSSMVVLLLVFVDRAVYKHKIKNSPFQVIALLGGSLGLLYHIFLLILLILMR